MKSDPICKFKENSPKILEQAPLRIIDRYQIRLRLLHLKHILYFQFHKGCGTLIEKLTLHEFQGCAAFKWNSPQDGESKA